MNTLRSPAPSGSFFNSLNSTKNKGIINSVVTATNTMMNTAKNTSSNIMKNTPSMTYIILLVIFIFVICFLFVFWNQILQGIGTFYEQIRTFFGAAKSPPPPMEPREEPVTKDPVKPQEDQLHRTNTQKIVEKILPGSQQVFNISKNTYTYYDAEPLCKALGSDLATYEQVKQAYGHGADWCNYGWVKGQMAVYPTQTNTWEQLQNGPEEQRGACGRPGLNGGYFDNPELQFGVNCYGIKPEQKDHDATTIAAGDGAPLSPSGLEFERKVNKYRGESNSIAVMPFSKNAWSS